jgi:hypothetical protein
LIVDPTACDQHCRCVRGRSPARRALRSVLGDGACLDTVVAQKQQRLSLQRDPSALTGARATGRTLRQLRPPGHMQGSSPCPRKDDEDRD